VHEYFLRRGLAFSEPFTTSPSVEGIAIWSHSDQWNKRNFLRIIASGAIWQAIKIGYKAMQKMRKFDEYVENKHRELMPEKHWYLSVLAVDPDYQGNGYGSQLIRGMLSRIDEEGLPCYVETEGEKNVAMYEHFGFEVLEEFTIPNSKDKLIAMLRKPQKDPNKQKQP
jgi:ribosomal protein S18 acetylase RimI-like enzyme